MPHAEARAWGADVQHPRDGYERTDEARRRADEADLAARRAIRERRGVEGAGRPPPRAPRPPAARSGAAGGARRASRAAPGATPGARGVRGGAPLAPPGPARSPRRSAASIELTSA